MGAVADRRSAGARAGGGVRRATRIRGLMEAAERQTLGAAAEVGGGSEALEAVIAAELALLDGVLSKGSA